MDEEEEYGREYLKAFWNYNRPPSGRTKLVAVAIVMGLAALCLVLIGGHYPLILSAAAALVLIVLAGW